MQIPGPCVMVLVVFGSAVCCIERRGGGGGRAALHAESDQMLLRVNLVPHADLIGPLRLPFLAVILLAPMKAIEQQY